MSDFTYVPSYRSAVTDEQSVTRGDFGDGYVATSPNGINPVKEMWHVVFENIKRSDGDAIRAFLKSKVGSNFTWTPPGASEKRWRQVGNVEMPFEGPTSVTLTVVFEEVFGA